MRAVLQGLVLLFCAVASSRAGLAFQSTELVLRPEVGDTSVRGEFAFKNTGGAPVSIKEVSSSCGCTVPEKPEGEFAPGSSGVLPVLLKISGRSGLMSQTVTVVMSDGHTQNLSVIANVPARVTFAPRLLLFRAGSNETKSAVLTFDPAAKTTLLDVSTTSEAFALVGTPLLVDDTLKIELRHAGPASADARASIRVRTRDGRGTEHTDLLYARYTP